MTRNGYIKNINNSFFLHRLFISCPQLSGKNHDFRNVNIKESHKNNRHEKYCKRNTIKNRTVTRTKLGMGDAEDLEERRKYRQKQTIDKHISR